MAAPTNSQQLAHNSQIKLDRFLVCGLGGLGQHCVLALKEFGVRVSAIDSVAPKTWEISNLADLLDELIIGDCRQTSVLEQAKIEQYRAVLIVTSNERVNAELALTVRQLNPETRLVVRSAQENLNELLSKHLGNFVAFEPTQLPVTAFALAALGTETLGFFNLEGQWLRVVQKQLLASDSWCERRHLYELNSRTRRVLGYTPNSAQPSRSFYEWEPDARMQPGDVLVYIETTDKFIFNKTQKVTTNYKHKKRLFRPEIIDKFTWKNLKQQIMKLWQVSYQQQTRRVAIFCGMAVLALLLLGIVLFHWYYPQTTVLNAFYATAILLLGGYGDLFPNFQQKLPIPWWLQLFSLILTLAGTAFVGVLYALLTETLLASKFQFYKRRPPVPQQDHIVIVGLGRVGQRVAALLAEFKQPIVGVTINSDLDMTILPEMPLIMDTPVEALAKANMSTAKSTIVGTEDEIVNLEISLMARAANPNSTLVIRTFEQRLSDKLMKLLPNAQVLCANAITAEAFAGAAFGENIISLFRLNHQTILVTEYHIEADDTLNGLLLSEVAYGYGVVPILHQKLPEFAKLMPSEDTQLVEGDRMVVLATIDGLRRIEQGILNSAQKCWQVVVERALTQDAVFEGANAIARISNCDLATARNLMHHLPGIVRPLFYKHQAQRLVRELNKCQVRAQAVEIASQNGTSKNATTSTT